MILRGRVVENLAAGPVVQLRLRHPGIVGPIPSTVAGLAEGDDVLLVDDLDGLADSFAVIGKLA